MSTYGSTCPICGENMLNDGEPLEVNAVTQRTQHVVCPSQRPFSRYLQQPTPGPVAFLSDAVDDGPTEIVVSSTLPDHYVLWTPVEPVEPVIEFLPGYPIDHESDRDD